ncbi:MAG: hypothetical protein JL55_18670 [Pseudomonas sp. BICA1-14]|nr:antirestriction protein [[Pseudomonas] sp. BICA1-14]KJS76198.1 MAG: hypothetical protein JL55_18670 [[Pseudomonas] sp. BICA1-14]HBW09412.1 hypothetical protein [Pseudomonas sp.]
MKTYSDNGSRMAAAVDRVYGHRAMLIEGVLFHVADINSAQYMGGTWNFVTNDEGTLGFWYPTARDTYSVECENYFAHEAMDARSFGAACTLVALNHAIWTLHAKGNDISALSETFHALQSWVYDLGEGDEPFIDTATVAGFTD